MTHKTSTLAMVQLTKEMILAKARATKCDADWHATAGRAAARLHMTHRRLQHDRARRQMHMRRSVLSCDRMTVTNMQVRQGVHLVSHY